MRRAGLMACAMRVSIADSSRDVGTMQAIGIHCRRRLLQQRPMMWHPVSDLQNPLKNFLFTYHYDKEPLFHTGFWGGRLSSLSECEQTPILEPL